MQAFQTSVYCGLGIFHFFLAFDFWFSDLVSMWFSVFRMWVPLSFRSEQHWSQIAANWSQIAVNWSQIAVEPLYPPLVCWRSSRNLIVEMSKFIGFACGYWYWSNFFPVFRFWMIFFMVLWFLIDPNTSLNMYPDIWIAYWWSLSGDKFDWIQFTCRQECNNLLSSASL